MFLKYILTLYDSLTEAGRLREIAPSGISRFRNEDR
jgi:hypothetical protein